MPDNSVTTLTDEQLHDKIMVKGVDCCDATSVVSRRQVWQELKEFVDKKLKDFDNV